MEEGTSDRGSASVQRPQWHEALQRLGSEAAHEPQQQGIGWVAAMLLLVSLVLAATMQQRQILSLEKELREVQRQAQLAQQSREQRAANLELSPAITPHSSFASLAEQLEPRVVLEAGAQGPSFELEAPLHVCPGPAEPLQNNQNTWWSRCIAAAILTGVLFCSIYAYVYIDHLPASVREYLDAFVATDLNHPKPLSKLLAYVVDGYFSTNPYSKTLALLVLTVYIIVIGSLGIYVVTGDSLYAAFWQAVAGVGIDWTFADETDVPFGTVLVRITAAVISIGGMLITALMLGLTSDAISNAMEGWKKGHSDVLESQHTLILGWSDKVISLVDQLCLANESEGGRPIVVLAELPKEEMEETFSKHVRRRRGSRIICRSGNPLLALDLDHVSLSTARSAIVLASSADTPDRSDARVLRIVLSLMTFLGRTSVAETAMLGHVVAEISDLDNEPLVKMVGGTVHTIVSHDVIGRLMIQCARQPGLAAVWEKLMGFEGDEFYSKEWPELEGMPFSTVILKFPLATPIGVESDGSVTLNPAERYILKPGDKVIVLAEDDNSYEPRHRLPDLGDADDDMQPGGSPAPLPEVILFCGWRRDLHDMIIGLDEFVQRGSELWLYNNVPLEEREAKLLEAGLDPRQLINLRLVYQEHTLQGEMVCRKNLEALNPQRFSSILLLADDTEGRDVTDADSRSLATLLLLRDIQARALGASVAGPQLQPSVSDAVARLAAGGPKTGLEASLALVVNTWQQISKSKKRAMVQANAAWLRTMRTAVNKTMIISEILDPRTRALIQDLHVSEYVLSNELVSRALAMASESPMVKDILAELFVAEGNELYIEPANQYIRPAESVCFYNIMERARRRGRIAIGIKQLREKAPDINPKAKAEACLSLSSTESIVTLAVGAS